MHRARCPVRAGLALLMVFASTCAPGAELDFNTLEVPAETQSSGPAQPQAWTPARPSSPSAEIESVPKPRQRDESAEPGGAVFTPFAESPRAPSAKVAPHDKPAVASSGFDVPDLVLTLAAVLAGIAVLAWLLRRA
ncbi:hypothetical protein [Variovorax sp. GT1P44]|uniref:hypothetical protein n=1 Tax=Variovorax sp. GT1P44 TaxID=3443742 RepID=UPI003F453219